MAEDAGGDAPESIKMSAFKADGITAPLRHATFKRIWAAGLISNVGYLIQGVAVAWTMTEMASSADQVALVQTALGLPVMVMAMLAGAIADVHDRRIVAITSLCIAIVGGSALAVLSWLDSLTPNILLGLCFTVGCGTALMAPARQASVTEQVSPEAVPAAVALDSISYNIARCIGPAIGGFVIAVAGTVTAFVLNALSFLPLIVALLLWKRCIQRSPLPAEPLSRAVISGVRYVAHSPTIKILLTLSIGLGAIGSSLIALLPLVARELLHGNAQTYGTLLSSFGVGAVVGALNITQVRKRLTGDEAVRLCALMMGAAIAAVALSHDTVLTAIALIVAGSAWIVAWTLFSIGVQLATPPWVAGRSIAAYQAAMWGGIAIGSWIWGHLTNAAGVETALLVSAVAMLISPLCSRWLPMPNVSTQDEKHDLLAAPEVSLPLTGQDGPLVVEIEYRVARDNATKFCGLMQEIQLFRQRNGAYGWSIARDIADPELWTERYQCPTWHDYLRQRNRPTRSERMVEQRALDLHLGPDRVRVRRMVEGLFGQRPEAP